MFKAVELSFVSAVTKFVCGVVRALSVCNIYNFVIYVKG